MNTTARRAPPRGFRLLVALAACMAACATTVALGGDQRDSGFVPLSGSKARQFLMGNSIEESSTMAEGSEAGPDVQYLADEKTVFEGSLDSGACSVEPWGFHGHSYCRELSGTKPACFPFHVLVPKHARTNQAKVGDVIGYFVHGDVDGGAYDDVHDPTLDDPILRGNATGCPLIGKSRPAKPLEISAAQSSSRPFGRARRLRQEARIAGTGHRATADRQLPDFGRRTKRTVAARNTITAPTGASSPAVVQEVIRSLWRRQERSGGRSSTDIFACRIQTKTMRSRTAIRSRFTPYRRRPGARSFGPISALNPTRRKTRGEALSCRAIPPDLQLGNRDGGGGLVGRISRLPTTSVQLTESSDSSH